ncbi:hypothetical protein RQP46_009969 [Phenoliferia psychrophenolica]
MGSTLSCPEDQLTLTTSGSLFNAPNASYTCPPFQLEIGGGVGPFSLLALNDSIVTLLPTNPIAATVKYVGTSAVVRSIDFPSNTDYWAAGSKIDFYVVDKLGSSAITASVLVAEFDPAKCHIE